MADPCQAHAAICGVASGQSADAYADKALGRMAWKEKPAFLRQLSRWSAQRVTAGLNRVLQAERDGKLSGAGQDLIAARALLGLASR